MRIPTSSRLRFLARSLCPLLLITGLGTRGSAQTYTIAPDSSTLPAVEQQVTPADQGYLSSFANMIDQLPNALANRLPAFSPDGDVHVYTSPHLGDLFHSGYVRVPVGVRAKLTDRIACNAELQSYFAHGMESTSPYGLSQLTLGAKCEHALPWLGDTGLALGFNYITPLSHPPEGFSDGYRRFQPYVSAIHMLVPKWGLLGYASFGANLLQRTDLPSDFGRNQLHANSLALTTGVTREWKGLQLSLTTRFASTEFISDEGRQNFSVRPEIAIPFKLSRYGRTHFLVTLDGRVLTGPEGTMINKGGGVRIMMHVDHAVAAEDYR
jgi:hypothetical protein